MPTLQVRRRRARRARRSRTQRRRRTRTRCATSCCCATSRCRRSSRRRTSTSSSSRRSACHARRSCTSPGRWRRSCGPASRSPRRSRSSRRAPATSASSRSLAEMREQIENGVPFSEALAEHASVFPPYYVGILRSSELTGQLDTALEQLSTYIERDLEARSTDQVGAGLPDGHRWACRS